MCVLVRINVREQTPCDVYHTVHESHEQFLTKIQLNLRNSAPLRLCIYNFCTNERQTMAYTLALSNGRCLLIKEYFNIVQEKMFFVKSFNGFEHKKAKSSLQCRVKKRLNAEDHTTHK